MSLPLTPQEKALFSRYGNNNFTADAFYAMPVGNGDSGFTSTHYQNQDLLSGDKQTTVAGGLNGSERIITYKRQQQRASVFNSLVYETPFM